MEKKIETIEEYIKEISKLDHSQISSRLYRGQANAEWSVHSSGYRRLSKKFETPISGIDMQIYLVKLLNDARLRTTEHKSDIELLIEIQHFGGATNLIDFSKNPLVALFFACNGEFNKDGKVITADSSNKMFYAMELDKIKETKIPDIYENEENEFKNLFVINPPFQNYRVIKQESVLIMSKTGKIEDSNIEKLIVIDQKAKTDILNKLKSIYCISEETLFIDFHGWALQNGAGNSLYLSPYLYTGYGIKLQKKGDWNSRVIYDLYSRAIEIYDKNFEFYMDRMYVIHEDEKYIESLEKMIELKPDFLNGYIVLAHLYAKINKDKAKYYLDEASKHDINKEYINRIEEIKKNIN